MIKGSTVQRVKPLEPGDVRVLDVPAPRRPRPSKPSVHIAIALPSRGVGHMRTIAGIVREVEPYSHSWHFSIGHPIPDSHNQAVKDALADPRTSHVWMTEDDHVYPVGVLAAMLAVDALVVAVNYPLRHKQPAVKRHPDTDQVVLVPMGCTLIRREVFSQIADPPFQVDTHWELRNGEWFDTGQPCRVGGHDPFFSRECLKAGIRMEALEGWECGHLNVVRAGQRTNYGMDEVIMIGGRGDLPWTPELRRVGMGDTIYLRAPNRKRVIDMDEDKAAPYLRNKWTKITKAEFDRELKVQQKHEQEIAAKVAAERRRDE